MRAWNAECEQWPDNPDDACGCSEVGKIGVSPTSESGDQVSCISDATAFDSLVYTATDDGQQSCATVVSSAECCYWERAVGSEDGGVPDGIEEFASRKGGIQRAPICSVHGTSREWIELVYRRQPSALLQIIPRCQSG